ncbi:hypothetical protein BDR07DRAFT_446803 [Suillus spraguei]|nr:hypothetical protein BDR07DRAFT_446803 [Suillus spraguei]
MDAPRYLPSPSFEFYHSYPSDFLRLPSQFIASRNPMGGDSGCRGLAVPVPAPAFKGNRPCFLFPIRHLFKKMKILYITSLPSLLQKGNRPCFPSPERQPSLLAKGNCPCSQKETVPAVILGYDPFSGSTPAPPCSKHLSYHQSKQCHSTLCISLSNAKNSRHASSN